MTKFSSIDDAAPPRTSTDWLRHFERNANALLDIPWERGPELDADDRRAIARSVQEFQRGESSEGRRLLQYANVYAAASEDVGYLPALRMFLAEEHRHAADLGRFLTLHGISLARHTAPDRAFRLLRHLASTLEVSIAVLITAEIIAQVYYAALHDATASVVLRRLCEQILRDEASHVEFQAEQLGKLRARHGEVRHRLVLALQRALFVVTCTVVWSSHRRVLRRGGGDFAWFWRSCWLHFDAAFVRTAAVRHARRTSELRRLTSTAAIA